MASILEKFFYFAALLSFLTTFYLIEFKFFFKEAAGEVNGEITRFFIEKLGDFN
jgi:hypothetical protein